MAEKNADKEALKAAKEAEKAAKKAKAERIKQSKPKKEGTVFSRAGKNIKKFCKDFAGTCKKIVWPGRKQVFKSSLVVLVCILVIGAVIFGFDRGLTALFSQGTEFAVALGEKAAEEDTTAEETTAADGEATVADEETTAADEETTVAAEDATASDEQTTASDEQSTAEESTAA